MHLAFMDSSYIFKRSVLYCVQFLLDITYFFSPQFLVFFYFSSIPFSVKMWMDIMYPVRTVAKNVRACCLFAYILGVRSRVCRAKEAKKMHTQENDYREQSKKKKELCTEWMNRFKEQQEQEKKNVEINKWRK